MARGNARLVPNELVGRKRIVALERRHVIAPQAGQAAIPQRTYAPSDRCQRKVLARR
jgi:hypothetical protein